MHALVIIAGAFLWLGLTVPVSLVGSALAFFLFGRKVGWAGLYPAIKGFLLVWFISLISLAFVLGKTL